MISALRSLAPVVNAARALKAEPAALEAARTTDRAYILHEAERMTLEGVIRDADFTVRAGESVMSLETLEIKPDKDSSRCCWRLLELRTKLCLCREEGTSLKRSRRFYTLSSLSNEETRFTPGIADATVFT
jgi:hypothetical protein